MPIFAARFIDITFTQLTSMVTGAINSKFCKFHFIDCGGGIQSGASSSRAPRVTSLARPALNPILPAGQVLCVAISIWFDRSQTPTAVDEMYRELAR